MSIYIEKEKVIDLFKEYQPRLATNVYEFGEKLRELPTAEVKPIVYGKWIYLYDFDGLEICECNKCGVSQEFDGGIFDVNSRRANFCPNCGAKMKKKSEEEE